MVAVGVGKLIKKVIMWIQAAFPLQLDTGVSHQSAQRVRGPALPSAECAARLSNLETWSAQPFASFEYVHVFQGLISTHVYLFEWLLFLAF